MNKAYDFKM